MPRSSWTDTGYGFSRALDRNKVFFVAIHYPADSGLKPPKDGRALTQAQVAQRLRAYRRYHTTPKPFGRGWADIGYCFAADQAGRIWDAAGKRVAAHSASAAFKDANQKGIGILLIIGNNEAPSDAMIGALNEFIGDLKFGFPGIRTLWPHRGVPGAETQCPGNITAALISRRTINLSGRRILKYSKDYITDLQNMLNEVLKTNLLPDGDLGPITIEAVKQFQKKAGLVVDGDPGPVTIAALKKILEEEMSDVRFIKYEGRVFITDGVSMSHVGGPTALRELQGLYNTRTITPVGEALFKSIPVVKNISLDDVSKAVQDGLAASPGGVDAGQVADQVVDKIFAKITN